MQELVSLAAVGTSRHEGAEALGATTLAAVQIGVLLQQIVTRKEAGWCTPEWRPLTEALLSWAPGAMQHFASSSRAQVRTQLAERCVRLP